MGDREVRGLRLGELRALRVEDVDLEAGVIRVERTWDAREGAVEPKSRAGRRVVPIVAALRSHLAAHMLRLTWRDGLLFGRRPDEPFTPGSVNTRAVKAWTAAGLEGGAARRHLPRAHDVRLMPSTRRDDLLDPYYGGHPFGFPDRLERRGEVC